MMEHKSVFKKTTEKKSCWKNWNKFILSKVKF